MRPRICTIDSSCVIALDHLKLMPVLSFLFSTVLVPKAVRTELFRRRATKDRVQALFGEFAFLQRCNSYDQGTVDFLLAERARQGTEDRGEVEAVVQAVEAGATVLVDDAWGRELAARDDLEFHGTMWVLQRFHELGLVSPGGLRASFEALRQLGIRLPWEDVKALLANIGEAPVG